MAEEHPATVAATVTTHAQQDSQPLKTQRNSTAINLPQAEASTASGEQSVKHALFDYKTFNPDVYNALFKGTSYIDICVYNLWRKGAEASEITKKLGDNYSSILTFATFLAGFQFVGLQTGDKSSDPVLKWSAFLLVMGLIFSALSACCCVAVIEFMRFMEEEPGELILVALSKYKIFMQYVATLALISSVLFITSINLGVAANMDLPFAIVIHAFSGAAVVFMLFTIYTVTFRRQQFVCPPVAVAAATKAGKGKGTAQIEVVTGNPTGGKAEGGKGAKREVVVVKRRVYAFREEGHVGEQSLLQESVDRLVARARRVLGRCGLCPADASEGDL